MFVGADGSGWLLTLVAPLLGLAACTLDPVDFTGKSCSGQSDCPMGYRCETLAGVCVKSAAVADGSQGDAEARAPDADVVEPTDAEVVAAPDAGETDASIEEDAGLDAGTCTPGMSCVPTNPCHAGSTSCSAGTQVCDDTGATFPNGTSCGTDKVCDSGACVACTSGTSCDPANPRRWGTPVERNSAALSSHGRVSITGTTGTSGPPTTLAGRSAVFPSASE